MQRNSNIIRTLDTDDPEMKLASEKMSIRENPDEVLKLSDNFISVVVRQCFPNRKPLVMSASLKQCLRRAIHAYSWIGDYTPNIINLVSGEGPKTVNYLSLLSKDNSEILASTEARSLFKVVSEPDDVTTIWSEHELHSLKAMIPPQDKAKWQPLLTAKILWNSEFLTDCAVGLWLKYMPQYDSAIYIRFGYNVKEFFAFKSTDFKWERSTLSAIDPNFSASFLEKNINYIETGEHFEEEGVERIAVNDDHICSNCGIKSQYKHPRCSGCRKAWYCSKKCQKSDWTVHKFQCH